MKFVALLLTGFALLGSGAHADLVGWWQFDDDFSDGSGNGLDGSELGEPSFADPVPAIGSGKSLNLSGDDLDGVTIDADDLLSPDIFTLAYFVNQGGAAQNNAGLERLTSREGDSFETAIGDANALGGTASETGTTLSYFQGGWNVTDVEIPEDGWVHVAWRNTDDEMQLFIDGVMEYTGPAVDPGRASGFMNIGIRHNDVEGFEGSIDDVFLWDDGTNPLTDANITTIAAGGLMAFLGEDQDLDDDGLPDTWETANGLDPEDATGNNGATGDPDGDTIDNAEELANGTHPNKADTDGDTLSDGEEKTLGTDPTVADTDGDTLSDGDEKTRGTNPLLEDTDGDGFNDNVEVDAGTDPTDEDSKPDTGALLLLHLKLDGDFKDASGSSRDGDVLGEPEFDPRAPLSVGGGQSALLNDDSEADGVTVAGDDDLGAEEFTMMYWIYPTASQSGPFERLSSRSEDLFETAIGGDPLTLRYYQGAWNTTDAEVEQHKWTHVAFRNSGDEMEIFVDGKSAFVGDGVPAERLGADDLFFGTRHNSIEGFEGLMDDIRIYGGALPDADILAIATATPDDTDGDGLPNLWETANALDPDDATGENGAAGDPDGDTLANLAEFENGTDPKVADTDGDTLSDGAEIAAETNPLSKDTDSDGVEDNREIELALDPKNPDTDGDTFGDGLEIDAGTDPKNPASFPKTEEGLIVHLTFDDVLDDAALRGNDGESLADEAEFSDDISDVIGAGRAIAFNSDGGEGGGVEIQGTADLAPDDFTMAYWIKPTEEQGNAGLERLTSRGGDQFETAIGDANALGGGDGALTLSYYQGSWNVTDVVLDPDVWSHVVWRNRADDDVMEIFVNGVNVYEGVGVPPGRVTEDAVLKIGTRHNNLEGYEGLMDDFRLYNSPLSDEQISELATTGGGGGGVPPQIIAVSRDPATATITWESRANQSFVLEFSDDLDAWLELDDSIPSGGETTSATDSTATADIRARFYRVRAN